MWLFLFLSLIKHSLRDFGCKTTSQVFYRKWTDGNHVFRSRDLILRECSGFIIPQVKCSQESSCLWHSTSQSFFFVCTYTHSRTCTHTNIHTVPTVTTASSVLGTWHVTPSNRSWCGVCYLNPQQLLLAQSPAQVGCGDQGHWPALAQVEAGPRVACVRCGDASTPPRRSRPSHAGEGSGSDGWYRGFPRGCGFLGLGSPSSGAVHTASPGERGGRLH